MRYRKRRRRQPGRAETTEPDGPAGTATRLCGLSARWSSMTGSPTGRTGDGVRLGLGRLLRRGCPESNHREPANSEYPVNPSSLDRRIPPPCFDAHRRNRPPPPPPPPKPRPPPNRPSRRNRRRAAAKATGRALGKPADRACRSCSNCWSGGALHCRALGTLGLSGGGALFSVEPEPYRWFCRQSHEWTVGGSGAGINR